MLFEILWSGQTPGKRLVGVRVIRENGYPIRPIDAVIRNLVRIVDWLPFFYAIGMACAFLTKGNKRLGDLVVGSIVVRETSLSDLRPVWQAGPTSSGPQPTFSGSLGGQNLNTEEGALVESFLSRRGALEPDVRFRIADEVLRKIRPKLTLPER